jgi:hypothetical protein
VCKVDILGRLVSEPANVGTGQITEANPSIRGDTHDTLAFAYQCP